MKEKDEKTPAWKKIKLRQEAEHQLYKSKPKSIVFGDMRQLIHELQVHQIELEMQNEELRKTQDELRKSLDNYFDFYNFTPVGYFTFDEKGMILDLNITSTNFLGVPKGDLINRNFRLFISLESRPVFNEFCKNVLETNKKQTCELKIDKPSRVVLIEGMTIDDTEKLGKKIRAVMIDITERKEMEENLRKNKEMLERAIKVTFNILMLIVEKNTYQTSEHRQRLVKLSCAIAKEMGLPKESIEVISIAAQMLDLGYISIPVDILIRQQRLNMVESAIFRNHPLTGFNMLKDIEVYGQLATIVLQHHERIDGSGYPNSLKGNEILKEAKILAVADTVEEICCNQPYRSGLGIDAALAEIKKNKGILYDTDVVDACVRLFHEKGFTFE